MVEEIAPGVFRMPIPLPGSILGSVNAYAVKGRERSLIVDPGMDLDPCMREIDEGLRRIGIDAAESDFFITHAHPDHFPLVARLIRAGSVIYIDRREAESRERAISGAMFAVIREFLRAAGFPDTDLREILSPEITQPSPVKEAWPFTFVKDGYQIGVGDYRFHCVSTPGHSPGHTCLYEPASGILLAGDHLLWDITPGIQARIDREDPLADYLDSLDRVYPLDVRVVLPGHRDPFTRFRERIDELKEHHRERGAEIASELKGGGRGVYELASRITWSVVDAGSWDAVPDLQKLLATGETFAHLKHLEATGALRSEMRDGRIIFFLARAAN
jgi:glyoxylase-like metal-dependent hydrolase (beta-lactamase superfamily II)